MSEDKAMQTEEPTGSSAESDKTATPETPQNETDKGVQADDISVSTDSQAIETPETSAESSPLPPIRRVTTNEAFGPPPPPPPPRTVYIEERRQSSSRGQSQHQQYLMSDGESSASPISELDDLLSDDDQTSKQRPVNNEQGSKLNAAATDEEHELEPWNAVCIVGFRVYSQDEDLELKIFDEALEEQVKEADVTQEKDDEGTDGDIEDIGDDEKKNIPIAKKDEVEVDAKRYETDVETKIRGKFQEKIDEKAPVADNEKIDLLPIPDETAKDPIEKIEETKASTQAFEGQ